MFCINLLHLLHIVFVILAFSPKQLLSGIQTWSPRWSSCLNSLPGLWINPGAPKNTGTIPVTFFHISFATHYISRCVTLCVFTVSHYSSLYSHCVSSLFNLCHHCVSSLCIITLQSLPSLCVFTVSSLFTVCHRMVLLLCFITLQCVSSLYVITLQCASSL